MSIIIIMKQFPCTVSQSHCLILNTFLRVCIPWQKLASNGFTSSRGASECKGLQSIFGVKSFLGASSASESTESVLTAIAHAESSKTRQFRKSVTGFGAPQRKLLIDCLQVVPVTRRSGRGPSPCYLALKRKLAEGGFPTFSDCFNLVAKVVLCSLSAITTSDDHDDDNIEKTVR